MKNFSVVMVTLSSIALLAVNMARGAESSASPAKHDWQSDPQWNETRYGAWGGPGVNPTPGPMDGMLLKDYAPRSSVVTPETLVPRAKYPVIDLHTHIANARTPAEVANWVKTMDEVGIEMSVLLTNAVGPDFDRLVELYLRKYPTRFQLYCGLDMTAIEKPDYAERAAAELERCYRAGARGVGELTDKGWGFTFPRVLPRNQRLHPDDPRLDRFWDKCAELKIPAVLHISDHPSSWMPVDVYQERTPDFQQYNQFGKDVLSYQELLDRRDRLVARHPRTTFIACHLGNQGNDLATLSQVLDHYPNLFLDIAARDYEVGRTPRAAACFLGKYRDRIVFGTDMGREKSMYQAWWRLFETADENMPGRIWWRYYGLDLPDPVLRNLYRDNARRLMNWQK
jgi:uncharacterized protein